MERRLNTKLENYLKTFKDGIRDKIIALNIQQDENINQLIEYIYDYNRLTVDKEDFIKRKRVKNSIPENNRCMAKRANGEQCTRRRRVDCEFCGTHSKGTPHGLMDSEKTVNNQNFTIDVVAKEIKGIVYYIDNFNNVYNSEDIMQSKENPQIIARYEKIDDNTYTIPSLGLL
jgi:hypothetical protein|tara:strand:- start:12413 stop:12931 length:519 start_codon:yes stop_codon:yes gene_type:complete